MDIVGGSLLSAFLQVLFNRMAKPEFLHLFRDPKYDVRVRDLLKKMKMKLLILQPVLDDAESKQTKEPAVKEWLGELQNVVYQADDLVDEINTEALRVKIESQRQSSLDQVSASTDFSHFRTEFLKEILPRIEYVVNSLEEFVQQVQVLGLVKKGGSKKKPFRLSSTSLVDETDVYGRDSDKDKIIGTLLSVGGNRESLSVISIAGLGGLGKTTLAQLVYNDRRVKEHFETKAWVCISEVYDAIRITKELLQELKIPFGSEESFNSLQVKLKEGLTMKKFLIVLDDLWNKEYSDWLALSSPFSGGRKGSKIIVTTRDENVARMLGSVDQLSFMAEEDCWKLFKKHAMDHRALIGNLEFESIAKKILRKCGGLPLAVKAIAGVLRSKGTVEEWKEILRSDEWEEVNNQTGLLPSLRLSYNDLPPQLKGCFALSAVFPKDYEFTKDEVIWLWMANGLLENPERNKRLEDRGDELFRELQLRFLFQQSSNGKVSMHDLVNDLAKFVSRKHVYRQEARRPKNTSLIGVRHFSYLGTYHREFEEFKLLYDAKFLRTFMPIERDQRALKILSRKLLLDILPTMKSLRFLSLVGSRMTELPNSLINLKQLRFLNFSRNRMTKLPSQICALYNLQTLLLADCFCLKELPEEMEKLINLRHLDLSGVRLSKMPLQIERLKGFQYLVLSTYTVGTDGGSRIEDLGKLSNLNGELTIFGLENVASGRDASMARIKDKKSIKKLTLDWRGHINDSQVVKDVLENLQPHIDIEGLVIQGYRGTRFSNWLGDSSYCHMISLRLSNCKNCFCLPALGQLSCLKHLTIWGLSKVLEMGQEVYGDTSSSRPFPCLEELKIVKMCRWKKWHIPENGAFARLEVLSVVDCPKLIGEFSRLLPSLRKSEISGCPGLVAFDGSMTIFETKDDLPQQFSSLRELIISNMPNLKELSASLVDLNKLLPNLETLQITKCPKMVSFPIETSSVSIGKLTFQGCHDSLKNLLHLRPSVVYIRGSGFTSFPEGWPPSSTLTDITFEGCNNLKSLPKEMQNLLPSLRRLNLRNCPEIECFPEGGLPSNLENLQIRNCEKLVSSLREWGLQRLPSLTYFHWADSHADSLLLEDLQLPCTLQRLLLYNHQNLKRLMVVQHFTRLQNLLIRGCPKLHSLPEEGLPASLCQLVISDCPLLKPRLEWEKGEDWPKVAHSRLIEVDGELIP